jgi:uncharacterized RmlC-like cupin family protein
MTVLEATRSNDKPIAVPPKASVVKSGVGYRAEQGSDYEPGVSAETVGSKSLWLGMITLPPGKRTRAHVTNTMKRRFTCSAAMKWSCGLAINFSIGTACGQGIISSFPQTCCT